MFLMFDAYTIILLTGAANYIYVIYRLCHIQFMLFTNCKNTNLIHILQIPIKWIWNIIY